MENNIEKEKLEYNDLKGQILKLLLLLYTTQEISEIFGIKQDKVKKIVKQLKSEGKWNKQIETEIKEKIQKMLKDGKTPEEISDKTEISYGAILLFKKNINKYTVKSKEEIEFTLKQIEILLSERAPIMEVIKYRKTLPKYWAKKIDKVIVQMMWKDELTPEDINVATEIKAELINQYIDEFEKAKNNLNNKQNNEQKNETKKGRRKREIVMVDDLEDDDIDGTETIKDEARINERKIRKIISRLNNNRDSKEDLKTLKKIIDTNNTDIEILDELICELIKTGKRDKILVAEYCDNNILLYGNIDEYPRKRMERLKKEIEVRLKKIDTEILKMSKKGVPVHEIAVMFGTDDIYIHQVRGLEDWTL